MRILYGVQGTGNGHIARARAMAKAFAKTGGAEVDFLFSGREADKFFSMEAFGDYRVCRGLSFITCQGRVDLWQTFLSNSLLSLLGEIRRLDLSRYDLVISDFEPVSAWAARRQNVPCIGLSHQNAFRFDVPVKDAAWHDKWLIEHFAPSDRHIGLHWFHFRQPIFPPIIDMNADESTEDPDAGQQDFVLVYLPFESQQDITELLGRFSDHQFLCYHPDVALSEQEGHIGYRPLDHEGFRRSLRACRGVIANGGFELPSEALSLGKKLLLKPLQGQFEQQSNVATLEALGMATAMDELTPGIVRSWLSEPGAEPVRYPDVATALVKWIMSGEWDWQEQLWQQLWANVCFPSDITLTNQSKYSTSYNATELVKNEPFHL